jgi:hypothetical protein
MRSRSTKKFKKFILPLTFILGLASFPLGSMLMGQVKKAHASAFSSPAKPNKKIHHAAVSNTKQKKLKTAQHKSKNHKAKAHKAKAHKGKPNKHLAHQR